MAIGVNINECLITPTVIKYINLISIINAIKTKIIIKTNFTATGKILDAKLINIITNPIVIARSVLILKKDLKAFQVIFQ